MTTARPMTDAEKHGKAICAECVHRTTRDVGFFTYLPVDYCHINLQKPIYNYVTGQIEAPPIAVEFQCKTLNPEGSCSGFRPIYEEFK